MVSQKKRKKIPLSSICPHLSVSVSRSFHPSLCVSPHIPKAWEPDRNPISPTIHLPSPTFLTPPPHPHPTPPKLPPTRFLSSSLDGKNDKSPVHLPLRPSFWPCLGPSPTVRSRFQSEGNMNRAREKERERKHLDCVFKMMDTEELRAKNVLQMSWEKRRQAEKWLREGQRFI